MDKGNTSLSSMSPLLNPFDKPRKSARFGGSPFTVGESLFGPKAPIMFGGNQTARLNYQTSIVKTCMDCAKSISFCTNYYCSWCDTRICTDCTKSYMLPETKKHINTIVKKFAATMKIAREIQAPAPIVVIKEEKGQTEIVVTSLAFDTKE